ncbi:MAG: hypothetical protein R3B90_23605, partial [Planctomycetaceae bacterium]
TIFISGLDERVTLSNPVAGYSSFKTRARVTSDLGDSEQTPSDLATVVDYTHLTAMRAPRPTLLTNNDRDRCCFAAGHALPPLLAAARPKYALFGAQGNLWAHINHVPGSHNFEQDNREALYRAFAEFFYPCVREFNTAEIMCANEVRSVAELEVPLPEGNAGFHTLAVRLLEQLHSSSALAGEEDIAKARRRLAEVVRLREWEVRRDLYEEPAHVGEVVAQWAAYHLGDEWTVPATELTPAEFDRTVLLVCDGGRAAAATQIDQLLRSRSRVIAIDPFYFGESRISQRDFLYGLLVAAVGERPLGIQAGQLRAIARHWNAVDEKPVEVHAIGRRLGLASLIAAATEPQAIASVDITGGFESLRQVIEENLPVNEAPELFCFGLLAEFDIPRIESLLGEREVRKHAIPSEPTARECRRQTLDARERSVV